MIDKIKVEIANRKKNFLREEYFELEDITSSVAMPIVNVDTLDDTLDVTNLTVYNTTEDPFVPFTKFIITLYEGDDVNRIYRYLDTDKVERKTFGKKGIYCHTLVLDEITKILEKETVPNLSFTNYLFSDSANALYEMSILVGTGVYGIFSYMSSTYSNSYRFPRYAEVGTIITNNVQLSVWCRTKMNWFGIPINNLDYQVPYSSATITTPDGTVSSLSSGGSYTLSSTGEYKIIQTYYINSSVGTAGVVPYWNFGAYWKRATITFTFRIKVVESIDNINRSYTISEVINRLLKCQETLFIGDSNQKYVLDSRIYDKLNLIESPEFNFTNSTLFEALSQIGGFIHAIPRLIPMSEMQKSKISPICNSYQTSGNNMTLAYNYVEDMFTLTPTGTSDPYAQMEQTLELVEDVEYKMCLDAVNAQGDEVSGIQVFYAIDGEYSEANSITFGTTSSSDGAIGSWVNFTVSTTGTYNIRIDNDAGEEVSVSNFRVEEVDEPNYYSSWNVVSFDFLSEGATYQDDEYSTSSMSMSADNYTRGLVSEVQNGLQSSYGSGYSVAEPSEYLLSFISPRSESGDFVITNENFCLKTLMPIGYIKKVEVYYVKTKLVYDITDHVVEKSVYNTLKSYDSDTTYESRFAYLYFTRGECDIKGCSAQENTSTWLQSLFSDTACSLDYIMKLKHQEDGEEWKWSLTSPATNYLYRVTYIPYLNYISKQQRYYIPNNMPDIYTFYNQNANVVDIEAFGENVNGTLARTSNAEYSETQYFKNFKSLPRIGQISNDKFYCFSVASEISPKTPIKATISWSENYNKLSEYVSYKKAIREYEVSENESFDRYLNYGEYLIISDSFDLGDYYTLDSGTATFIGSEDETDIENVIQEELDKVKFRVGKNLFINGAFLETFNEGEESTPISSFILPVSRFFTGNSYVLLVKTQDNYSAATTTEEYSGSIFDTGTRFENYIEYGDDYGRFDILKIMFCVITVEKLADSDGALLDDDTIYENSRKLYLGSASMLDGYTQDELDEMEALWDEGITTINLRNTPILTSKDSREAIHFVMQMHVVTDSPNVIFGRNMMHIVTDNDDKGIINSPQTTIGNLDGRKFVWFLRKPKNFEDIIDESDFSEANYNVYTYEDLQTFTIVPAAECSINCVGYGMLDENNKLICFIDNPLSEGDAGSPIYFMLRRKI